MNYYYDFYVNINDKYMYFYDWDTINSVKVKKCPIYKVSEEDLIIIMNNTFKIDDNVYDKIYNKSKDSSNNYYTGLIITDCKSSIYIEIDDNKILSGISSLLLYDEINTTELGININSTNIIDEVIKDNNIDNESNIIKNIRNLLLKDINKCYLDKNINKMKFIYLELFNNDNDNFDKMYNDIINRINSNITMNEYKLYEYIKISYNNV